MIMDIQKNSSMLAMSVLLLTCATSSYSNSMMCVPKVEYVVHAEQNNNSSLVPFIEKNVQCNVVNRQNVLKQNFNELTALFGGMRYLSSEGQEDYNKNLDKLFKNTDIQLFDLV